MAFDNITMNLSALNDISPPNISVDDSGVFSNIVSGANTSTEGYLIFGSLSIIFFIIYLLITDKTPLGTFGYDDMRGINIALSVTSIFALTIVSVGWSYNFYAVGMLITSWLVSYIIILIYENQE